MAGTKWIQVDGFVEWAMVFPENRDLKSSNPRVQKALDKVDGMYKVAFYPKDEAEWDKLWKAGLSEEVYNSDKPRRQSGNSDFGVGDFFIIKRKNKDIKEITDRDTGELIEHNFGGAPEIVHWSEDKRGEPWSYEDDGALGNGTEVKMKLSIYGEHNDPSATVRLEKLGIVNHVEYNPDGERF